jgi:formamidopyrimidine-DNA glycosylase
MPELPEVRAHAERLDADLAGAILAGFRPISFTALKTFSPAPEAAVGHPLAAVRQRGKHLLLDHDGVAFVVHLMQGGRLKPDDKQAAKPRGGIARWTYEDGRALLLTEAGTERKAGVWVVAGDPGGQEPLDHLGPEADAVDATTLLEILQRGNQRLHGALRDQRLIAGTGRRLPNEACHRAPLSPFAMTGKLDIAAAERLVEAIQGAIDTGLAYERTRDDMSASKDRPGAVHHRKGEACPVCGGTVRAVAYRAYEVDYCPTCQTDGKVLADNTTSKFLK